MAVKSKKKILYIITKSVWGGAGKYVYDLAINLPKDEFEIFVAAGGDGTLAQKIKEAGIPYHNVKNFQKEVNVSKEIGAFFEIYNLLKKIKPDIIHVSSSKAAGIAGIASFLYKLLTLNSKLLTLFTVHGWAFHEKRPWWQLFLIRFFSLLTCLFYNKVICVSKFDRLSAIKNRIAPTKKITAIHNGINQQNISFLGREEAQQKLMNKKSPLVIGTIAEWTKNKGLFFLFESLKKIKNKNFDVILIGGGENPAKEKMRAFAKKYELKNIYLHEWVPNAASYLKAFDIFVLPSLKEGFPYVLLEAAAVPLAVTASSVGGVPEIILEGKTGLLVKAGDADELEKSIEKLAADPKLRETLSQNLRQKATREFSFEKMLFATIATYEKNSDAGENRKA